MPASSMSQPPTTPSTQRGTLSPASTITQEVELKCKRNLPRSEIASQEGWANKGQTPSSSVQGTYVITLHGDPIETKQMEKREPEVSPEVSKMMEEVTLAKKELMIREESLREREDSCDGHATLLARGCSESGGDGGGTGGAEAHGSYGEPTTAAPKSARADAQPTDMADGAGRREPCDRSDVRSPEERGSDAAGNVVEREDDERRGDTRGTNTGSNERVNTADVGWRCRDSGRERTWTAVPPAKEPDKARGEGKDEVGRCGMALRGLWRRENPDCGSPDQRRYKKRRKPKGRGRCGMALRGLLEEREPGLRFPRPIAQRVKNVVANGKYGNEM